MYEHIRDDHLKKPKPNISENGHSKPTIQKTSPNQKYDNETTRMLTEIMREIKEQDPDGKVQCPRCELAMNKTSIRRHIANVHLHQKKSRPTDPLMSPNTQNGGHSQHNNYHDPNDEISRMVTEIAKEIKEEDSEGRVQCPRCD